MLLNNNYHSSCKFAPDILSYLYGEIDNAAKRRFELHLAICQICPGELAELSSVRSSIIEWRNEEFLPLAMPVIEIPFEQPVNIPAKFVESAESRSWISQIGAFFKLKPVWMTAFAGLAVIAGCIGLLLTGINSPQVDNTEVAHKENINNESRPKTVPTPATENRNSEMTASSRDSNHQKSTDLTKADTTGGKSNVVDDTPIPTKISLPSNPAKVNNAKGPKPVSNTDNKTPSKPKSASGNKRTTLSGDDDDDEDTLRLSDIFEEVSMR